MKGTEFEFRHRALLNLVQIWLAFQVYVLDHSNIVWWLCPWSTPPGKLLARLAFLFAALLVGLAAAIRTWAATYLGSDVVHDLRLHTENLVADGPYRHVRNPLYLGSFPLSIGLSFTFCENSSSSLGSDGVAGGAGTVTVTRAETDSFPPGP